MRIWCKCVVFLFSHQITGFPSQLVFQLLVLHGVLQTGNVLAFLEVILGPFVDSLLHLTLDIGVLQFYLSCGKCFDAISPQTHFPFTYTCLTFGQKIYINKKKGLWGRTGAADIPSPKSKVWRRLHCFANCFTGATNLNINTQAASEHAVCNNKIKCHSMASGHCGDTFRALSPRKIKLNLD